MLNYLKNRFSWYLRKKAPSSYRSSTVIGRKPSSRSSTPARIGLAGYNAATGLGYQNRDLIKQLGIEHWLVIESPNVPKLASISTANATSVSIFASEAEIREWLEPIDIVLFYEQPFIEFLPRMSHEKGALVVCIANWEWLSPRSKWIDEVDIFICPNQFTYELLTRWKRKSGHPWDIIRVPPPY
jgi:hypothetical protein